MSGAYTYEQGDSEQDQRRAVRLPVHIAFVVLLVGLCALYAETFTELISTWASTGRYQYAFLIFPVCVVLVWLRRDVLRNLAAAPKPLGLLPLGMLGLLWLAGAVTHVNVVTQFSVVAMIPCLVFTVYGTAITRALIFPLAYLFFAIPFGNFLVQPLQTITAELSVAALQWTSVPVFLDGHYIFTPATTWHVAEACSGVSFFFATTAFGVLYANLFYRTWLRRLLFVALALVTPIIANGLRVFFTILIGERFGLQYATGTDHLIFGWQFFGAVTVLLCLVGWPWHEPEAVPVKRARTRPGADSSANLFGAVWLFVAGLVILAAAPVWLHIIAARAVAAGPEQVLALPGALGGLPRAGTLGVESGPGTVFRNADAYARVRYGTGTQSVLVNVAVYGGTAENNELVTFGNRIFDAAQWTVAETPQGGAPSALAGFQRLRLVNRTGDDGWLIWYQYQVGSHLAASPAMIKFWRAWNHLLGQPGRARVVTLASPVVDGQAAPAAKRLARAAHELLPWLQQRTSGPEK